MAGKTIKFSSNWNNKLQNTVYTTIRKHNPYFEHSQLYDILLNGVFHHRAQLLHKAIKKGHQISEVLMWTDTGYSSAETIKILCNMHKITVEEYSSMDWDILYLKRLDHKHSDL